MLHEAIPIASEVSALLGPTNTGKTHRCIERMLEHQSGMMGLPLRLLAREVYDRITERLGESEVALVTGEEKRIPRSARYWVCTVEAMPLEREVDFVGVDEIQLVAHPTRGHIFTHRLLHARGRRETWFLGSSSASDLVTQLVPTARRHPLYRMSKLRHAGHVKLQRLPPRSALIAFSVPKVYELAERLRVTKGGAAVVLGALSPRARNRQVAMYQAGDVAHLVATDAIGMGLNLDLHHVAFSELRKFDGRVGRHLSVSELAQIAGRAGRHLRDGSFGTLKPGAPLSEEQVHCLEGHHIPPLRKAWWRNFELDFESPEALLDSLHMAPPHPALAAMPEVDDVRALQHVLLRPAIEEHLSSLGSSTRRQALGQLWEVCQIPDYPKLLPEAHFGLVEEVFTSLRKHQDQLPDAWLRDRIEPLGDTTGDLDTLTTRLAFVRTWSYVCQHQSWVRSAGHWRARTQHIEDQLSEALHERLTLRFVEKRGSFVAHVTPPRAKQPQHAELTLPDDALAGPFAQLAKLKLQLFSPEPAARETHWAEDAIDAEPEAFQLQACGTILFREQELAKLVQGKLLTQPQIRLTPQVHSQGLAAQLTRRMHAFLKDGLRLFNIDAETAGANVRGLAYQLGQGLGTLLVNQARPQLQMLSQQERQLLLQKGVCFGQKYVWLARSHREPAATWRRALCTVYFGSTAVPQLKAGQVSARRERAWSKQATTALGLGVLGTRVVRCDIAERFLAELRASGVTPHTAENRAQLSSMLGCPLTELDAILATLKSRKRSRRKRTRRS